MSALKASPGKLPAIPKVHLPRRRPRVAERRARQRSPCSSLLFAAENSPVKELSRQSILGAPPDAAFERVARLSTHVFQAAISLISLSEGASESGEASPLSAARRGEGGAAICAAVRFEKDAARIRESLQDPLVLAHPPAAGELGLRFYASTPLVNSRGMRLGALAVMDFAPRALTAGDEAALKDLADLATEAMELRLSTRALLGKMDGIITNLDDLQNPERYVTLCAWTKSIRVSGEWMSFERFLSTHLGISVTHGIHPEAARQFHEDDED
ncbi:GAF domain-containing protein [Lujinxingia sediminis]|uniref:GAF domain-containing protein n=1 Tax=Lujinxingia sediminis TaxID=2480984 RepID=A0ABY0CSX9_9DELT|nr:GAF domain-containing protein [Lujinxingia sediminis]